MRINNPITQKEYKLSPDDRLISSTDTRGKITYFNERFREVSGYDADELMGAPHNLIRHPDMPKAAFADMWDTIRAGKPWMGLVKNRRKNGDHYWVSAYVTPMYERGQLVGYESVRVAPENAQKERAMGLYRRLNEGKSPHTWLQRLTEGVRTLAPVWTAPILITLGLLLAQQWLWGSLSAVASIIGMFMQLAMHNKAMKDIRAIRPHAFANSVIAETYSNHSGARAELEMVLRSEEARARTGFTRIQDAAAGLHDVVAATRKQAELSSQLVDQQNQATQQTASAINEMTTSIQEVADSVEGNAKQAEEASTNVDQSSELAGEAMVAINTLSDSVRSIVTTVDELAQSTNSIGEAADIIASIADQTNLLALNAAIEAARAGEHGRGFSVVADEVRSLAAKTQESTDRIHGIIDQLRERAQNAVRVSSEGEKAAEAGVAKVQATERALQEIKAAVSAITDSTIQMSSAVEEQSNVAEHINQQITDIADGAGRAQQNSNETYEVSVNLEDTTEYLYALINRFALDKK
ncbi:MULTISPECIES: PAS domain-containing methyl-accepting chemotaxis protein [Gammaproteobacteria]|uniref:methyl-accepting chemotaxis protein n=1 Tax=Gammaproteobacteria TaxID=1236 RepID=UPI000DD02677|nr:MULTISPECIES: PAS domain-containing methyl-accepting chemotaxis protein [Gammaproteobacteria]RTE87054.1 PAS domain S-box protein [Aliidiomarina sp. B3213]TCZ93156.1 PAS domain S-box protein [Lysobacter sp. N42]